MQTKKTKIAWTGLLTLVAFVATLSFSGCAVKDDKGNTSEVKLAQTEISMPAEGKTIPVAVSSTSKIHAVVSEEGAGWLTVVATDKLLKVTATENKGQVRMASVAVLNEENATALLKVTQLGFDAALQLDADYEATPIEVDAAGKSIALNVYTNLDFTVVKDTDVDWLDVTASADKVNVTIDASPLFEVREATFTIKPASEDYANLAKKVKIKQAALVHTITATCAGLTEGKITVAPTDAELEVAIEANDAWTATLSEGCNWITVDPANGGTINDKPVSVVMSNNTGAEDRTATISFTSGDAKADIIVTQRGAGCFCDFDDAPITVQSETKSYVIPVSTNATTITVAGADNWISGSANGEKTEVTLAIEENAGDKRQTTVTITASIVGFPDVVKTVKVTQNQAAINLAVVADDKIETANCYSIYKAGTYKFPATVKGNGAQFYDEEGFPDKTVTPTLTIEGGKTATQIWSTKQTGLLSEVSYSGGYVYFTIDPFEVGNAAIAVKDVDGNVLWSWHIWATPFNVDDAAHTYTTGLTTPVDASEEEGDGAYYSGYAAPCTFMGLNLGATNDGNHGNCTPEQLQQACGYLYQWGRKDPFVGGTPDYTIAYTAPAGGANMIMYFHDMTLPLPEEIEPAETTTALYVTTPQETVDKTIQWAVEHPTVFIKSVGTYESSTWLSSGKTEWNGKVDIDNSGSAYWGHLWGNKSVNGTTPGLKSIYDPCPPGWQIPCPANWNLLTSHGDNVSPYYGSYAIWKYNCQEAIDAINDNSFNPLATKTTDAGTLVYDGNNMCKFNSFKGGWNVFVGSSNQGIQTDYVFKNPAVDDSERIKEDLAKAGTLPMFVPSAGWRMGYNGGCYQCGAAATYHENQPVNLDVSSNGGLAYWQTRGMSMWVDGSFYRNAVSKWGEWQAAGRSVRCVKQLSPEVM